MIIETRKVQINEQMVELIIRRNDRAKNIKIRCDTTALRVFLTLPKRASLKLALEFYEKSKQWLIKHLPAGRQELVFAAGGTLPFLGATYKIQHTPSKTLLTRFKLIDDVLHISGPPEQINDVVVQWLKLQALNHMTQISHEMAKQLGVKIQDIKIKDMKTRWGSCSSKKNLNYSWRIIMAPKSVAYYLCAHEVSHLIEMNHSPKFWALVNTLCPHYKESRRWLRTEGKKLFQTS